MLANTFNRISLGQSGLTKTHAFHRIKVNWLIRTPLRHEVAQPETVSQFFPVESEDFACATSDYVHEPFWKG